MGWFLPSPKKAVEPDPEEFDWEEWRGVDDNELPRLTDDQVLFLGMFAVLEFIECGDEELKKEIRRRGRRTRMKK